jgi:predicted O-methyltransferase YrrM
MAAIGRPLIQIATLLILVQAWPVDHCEPMFVNVTTSTGLEGRFEVHATENIRTRVAAALSCLGESSSVAIESVVESVCGEWKLLPFCELEFGKGSTVDPVGDPVLGDWYSNSGAAASRFDFSNSWHAEHVPYWRALLQEYVGREDTWALEIGSFEGQAAVWLLKEVLTHETSQLFCVDTFLGSPNENLLINEKLTITGLQARHAKNIEATGSLHKVTTIAGDSQVVLRGLDLSRFDIVYVDGSHTAGDVLQDAVLAWGLLKVGGIMVFDDYLWEPLEVVGLGDARLRPKEAIDAFVSVMAQELKVVHRGSQVAVRKVPLR